VPQIRPLADIVHSKYSLTYLLTYASRVYRIHVQILSRQFSIITLQRIYRFQNFGQRTLQFPIFFICNLFICNNIMVIKDPGVYLARFAALLGQ